LAEKGLLVLAKLVFVALTAVAIAPALAHDIYVGVLNKNGKECCSGHDCRPVRHRTTATGVEMEVDGRWVAVPSHTLEYRALEGDTGESYGAHWCGWIAPFSRNYITRCAFLPPRLGALH
jgi:hypothetical protein